MSIKVCSHIYNFEFVYENINIFLSNDHIWNHWNLNSHISQTQLDILFKFSGFSPFIKLLLSDSRFKAKIIQVPNNRIFRSRPAGRSFWYVTMKKASIRFEYGGSYMSGLIICILWNVYTRAVREVRGIWSLNVQISIYPFHVLIYHRWTLSN